MVVCLFFGVIALDSVADTESMLSEIPWGGNMSVHCGCDGGYHGLGGDTTRFRRILWVALAINTGMFLVEIVTGLMAGSSALQADALDFLGDAVNYAISLFVLGMALRRRAMASLLKGMTMGAFGLWVVGNTLHHLLASTVPEAQIMGGIGVVALVANGSVAGLLYAFREGDSNMRSLWICARNDAFGNLAVLLAASGVFATGMGWPDFTVAGVMAVLALSGSFQILRHAIDELCQTSQLPQVPVSHRKRVSVPLKISGKKPDIVSIAIIS